MNIYCVKGFTTSVIFALLPNLSYQLYASGVVTIEDSGGPSIIRQFTQTKQRADHTCSYAIDRVKKGPANYKAIIESGQNYFDDTFT